MKSIKISTLALVSTIAIAPFAFITVNAAPTDTHSGDSAFSATFSVSDSKKTIETYEITDPNTTISEFMESKGMNPDEYISPESKNREENRPFENGENFIAQKNEVSTKSVEKVIPRKVEKVDDPTLKAGETKVEAEGKDGKAIEVTIFEYSENDKKELVKTPVETRLTIVDTPVTKKVRVGTKVERPKVDNERSSRSSSTSRDGAGPGSTTDTDNGSVGGASSSISSSPSRSSGEAYIPQPVDVSTLTTDVERNNKILELARTQKGGAYIWGGVIPGVGFDCSGLTSWAYGQVGIEIPRLAGEQMKAGKVIPKSQAIPGDIVYWPGHVGIYAGGNTVVDAGNRAKGITERNIWGNPVFVTYR